jgi:hypothetical protein
VIPQQHDPACKCRDCQRDPDYWPDVRRGVVKALLWALAALVLLVIFGPVVWHAWYVDTHCTMVLGTQVCR